MIRNVYDFDKTIYHRDSTVDFIWFCIQRKPSVLLDVIAAAPYFFRVVLGVLDKTVAKERLFRFLQKMDQTESLVRVFWDRNQKDIHQWYLERKRPEDLVISASPDFLVREVTNRLGISLIASQVNIDSGQYTGKNCYGEEKVSRLKKEYPGTEIKEFYSDSRSDTPLALLAEKAYLVSGEKLTPFFQDS